MATSQVTAKCLVHTGLDATVTWLIDGSEAEGTKVNQASNKTHMVSEVKVSQSEWKKTKIITCRTVHQCFSSTERTVNIAGKMNA